MKRLFVVTLLCLAILTAVPVHAESQSTPATAQYLALIVLDGGRPDYITENLDVMPNVRQLVQGGAGTTRRGSARS